MDLKTTKIELAKLILNLENQSIIEKIIELIKSEQSDYWNSLPQTGKEEILLGIKQLDAGEKISLEDFLKKVS
jgi:hypothetical protein